MARSRNIKPKFFRDSKVVACSFEARLLFQGLWCLADYMGRLVYDPVDIKMEVFPGDDVNIASMMEELENNRLIQTYTDDSGRTLVQVLKFSKHQYPHKNERFDSKGEPQPHLPGPEDVKQVKTADYPEKPTEKQRVMDAIRVLREYYHSDPADSLNLIPDSLKLIPDSLKLIPDGEGAPAGAPPKPKKNDVQRPDDIDEQTWSDFLAHRRQKKAKLTPTAWKPIRKEIDIGIGQGYDPNDMLAEAMAAGWQGFKFEWYLNRLGKQNISAAGDSVDQQVRAAREYRENQKRQKQPIEGETTNERQ